MKQLILLLTSAVVIAFSSVRAGGLPKQEFMLRRLQENDCAISATEVFSRLRATGVWTRLFYVKFVDQAGQVQGHMMTVWQPFNGSPVFIYDQYFLHSSLILNSVTERDPEKIKVALSASLQGVQVIEVRFIE